MMKRHWKLLLLNLLIPLAVGGLSAWLTHGQMEQFSQLQQPPFAPPAKAFPIVWTILFLLMGISAYLVCRYHSVLQKEALTVYALQLGFNFFWSILFFNLQWRLFAFFWLLLLWGLILAMILLFRKISPLAGWLQLPYLLWVTFAGYLNLAIYILNG